MRKTSGHVTKSTVFVMAEQRKAIEESGKSLQQFFTDLLDTYMSHSMDKWRMGHMFHRDARMVFMRADNMNQLIQLLPNPYKAGRKLGDKTRQINLALLNLDGTKPTHRDILLHIVNKLSGWGVFTHPEPNKLILESPALKNEAFVRGFLEGSMADRLRTVYADSDRMVFQLVPTRPQRTKRRARASN